MTYGINAYIWDVELGNAAYIDAADRDVVIDMGSRGPFPPLQYINQRYGVNWLDYLIPSHLHYDHISNIHGLNEFDARPRLLNKNEVAIELLKKRLDEADPDDPNDQPLIEAGNRFLELVQHYTPTTEDPSDPEWADRATFTNYYLEEMVGGTLYEQMNNSSIVTAVERYGFKMVFAGDMLEAGLERLLKDDWATSLVADANVLIAPHHGRQNGFYGPFVSTVDPDVVIFSDEGGQAVGNGAQSQYCNYTTGIDVYNETLGEWESNRHVLTTRSDGRLLIQANSDGDWVVRKRPRNKTSRRQKRARVR